MNALELADELQNRESWRLINYIHWSEEAEFMLRQQQAEIEALKNRNWELVSEPWGFDRYNKAQNK